MQVRPGSQERVSVLSNRPVLEPLLVSALELCARNVERLDRYAPYWTAGSDPTSRFEDKVATECALIAMLARRVPAASATLGPARDRLVEALRPRVRSDRSRAAILRCPPLAATLGLGHVYLSAAGDRDPSWDRLVFHPLADGHAEATERPAHRLLDRDWARRLAGLPAALEPEQVLRFSIVRSRAHPLYMTAADAYAYTHTLMYLSDFGAERIEHALDAGRVAGVVEGALSWNLLEQDFDLLGEFLLCAEFLGRGGSPAARLAWAVLERAWQEFGFLPGPTFDPGTFARTQGDERAAYTFQQVYHTTLVGAALAAVRMSTTVEKVPAPAACTPLPTDGARSLGALVDEALRCTADARAPRPSWADIARADVVGTDEARRVLAEGLAIHAVRGGDRAQAACAFDDLCRLGSLSPTVPELADYLSMPEC